MPFVNGPIILSGKCGVRVIKQIASAFAVAFVLLAILFFAHRRSGNISLTRKYRVDEEQCCRSCGRKVNDSKEESEEGGCVVYFLKE